MKTAYGIWLRVIVMVLAIAPAQVSAKVTSCNNIAPSIEYLDENVVYCFTQASLGRYIDMADILDLDGMNYLVETGECSFVPDGRYLPLEKHESKIINSVPVIAVKAGDLTLWTFKKFVSYGQPDEPYALSGDSVTLALAVNEYETGQCR